MMFVVSHTYSNYLGRYSMVALVSEVTMPDWMSVPVAFGLVDSNENFSVSGVQPKHSNESGLISPGYI